MISFNFFKKSKSDNNELRKLKRIKRSLATTFVALVIVLFFSIAGFLNQKDSKLKKELLLSPEMARAMTYEQFGPGDENIEGTDNVKFSAFFLRDLDGDGYAEKIKGTCREVGKQDTLYMELNVLTAGKLINGKIEIENNNFNLVTTLPKDNELKNSYISQNTNLIEFNEIANGTQKMLIGIVRSGNYTSGSTYTSAIGDNTQNYSKENKIVFTGIYVDELNNETEIRKEINLDVDWYGTATANFYSTGSTYYDLPSRIDEENQTITLNAIVSPSETKNELLLKKNYLEGTIPELNGFAPIEVTCTTNGILFSYDETTRKFTITKEAELDDNGEITNSAYISSYTNTTSRIRYNSYSFTIKYPLEAYETLGQNTVTIKIPVKTYWEAYNNVNSEFTNPYITNEATSTITATFNNPRVSEATIDVTVGESVRNPDNTSSRYIVSKKKPIKIYNEVSEEEKDDYYNVKWYVYTGTNGEYDGLKLEEQSGDIFIKGDSSTESMDDVLTNVGIGFSGVESVLGEEGWIKVYDTETDELLVTFTKDGKDGSLKWDNYSQSNVYKYSMPTKHVRIETSATLAEGYMYVYYKKELNDNTITEEYTREEFDNLKYIRSNLKVRFGETKTLTDSHQAIYEAPFSEVELTISNDSISTQITEKNELIKIIADANTNYNQVPWKDGSFLVKFPDEIADIEINDISINNNNVKILSYEQIENENGRFIKINTENQVEAAQTYTITINANLSPDPRIATTTKQIELWASNEEAEDYYTSEVDAYDVNDNLNTTELVNKASTQIELIAPNSLLIAQTATEFDDKNSEVVSPQIADIRPQYAVVDGEENTAKIGVYLKNNYSSSVSEIKLIGVIPFEGNDYVISGRDLGSTFTTKMKSTGITLPAELQGNVSVYYSTNENPTKDLTDENNGWVKAEDVENWDNIKTFMVDFENYVLDAAKTIMFEYIVSIPNGLDFNLLSYSEAGVYFSLDTEEGKYASKTEPNKLGFRIAEKYNLVLEKYQTGKQRLVPGATYLIIKDGDEEGKTAVTDENGVLEITNLYAEETYYVQEMKTPDDYELNDNLVKFIGHVSENGTLSIEKLEGATKENITVTKIEGEDYKATVKVEDEAKTTLKIIKKGTIQDSEGTIPIKGARYKITGPGFPAKGKSVSTNNNGEATLRGLKVGEEYTLEEIKAEGYYLNEPIVFKIVNNNGTYEIETISGGDSITSSIITENDSLPIANVQILDEKIPEYTLKITKIKELTEVTNTGDPEPEIIKLQGTKFKLYKDNKLIGTYITDENGEITIPGLYQYLEEKNVNQTYTLKEVLAPEGYSKVKDITFNVERITETVEGTVATRLVFNETLADGQDSKEYTADGNTINLTIEDSPSFKIIKTDGETNLPLANVKFAIYNVDDGDAEARNSKGEIIGNKETINGREYYVVTTNNNGEITLDLPEGLYKAVEVETDEKYDLSNNEYYFGIGASREGTVKLIDKNGEMIGGTNDDRVTALIKTSDGGMILGVTYISTSIYLKDGTCLTNQTTNGFSDAVIIKYSSEGEIEWYKEVKGTRHESVSTICEGADGSIYVSFRTESNQAILEEDNIITTGSSWKKAILVKYSDTGELEWGKLIQGEEYTEINSIAATADNGCVIGGDFTRSFQANGNRVSTGNYDGFVIKCNSNGDFEWVNTLGGVGTDLIQAVSINENGDITISGEFLNETTTVGDEILTGTNQSYDGLYVLYSADGTKKKAGTLLANSSVGLTVANNTKDGGTIIAGYFHKQEAFLRRYTYYRRG